MKGELLQLSHDHNQPLSEGIDRGCRESLDHDREKDDIGQLLADHRPLVYRLCCERCGDKDEAEDICQKVMMKAWRKFQYFKWKSSFATWITKIAINECVDHARKRRPPTERFDPTITDVMDGSSISPPEDLIKRESIEGLIHAMSRLHAEERLIITLRFFYNLTYPEIGTILGINCGTARMRAHRTIQKLRGLVR